LYDERLTEDNKQFLDEVVQDKYGSSTIGFETKLSPLKVDPIEPTVQWKRGMKRTGLIAKKIGVYPLWLKNGKRVTSTLLQVNGAALVFNKQYHCYRFNFNISIYSDSHFTYYAIYFYTLIQVVDNEVVKYIPPEKFFPIKSRRPPIQVKNRRGCLVVGAENIDPQLVTCN